MDEDESFLDLDDDDMSSTATLHDKTQGRPIFDDDGTSSTTTLNETTQERPSERSGFSFSKVKDFFRPGGDKEGRTLFSGAAGRTGMARYTELRIPDGPPVRLLHNGRLTDKQKDQIRNNIATARAKVNNAIATLDKDVPELMRDPQACALLARHFGVMPEEIAYGQGGKSIENISNKLKSIADGLYSPKLEIKLTDTLTDEPGRFGKVQRAPYRHMEGRAKRGSYSDDAPGINLRFTKAGISNADRGSNNIISAAATNAANLSTRDANKITMFASNLHDLTALERSKERPAEDRVSRQDQRPVEDRPSRRDAPSLLPPIPHVSDFNDIRSSINEVHWKSDKELVRDQKEYLEQNKGSMSRENYEAINRALNEDVRRPPRYETRSRNRGREGRS